MKTITGELNRKLWALLGLNVNPNPAMTIDGTWVRNFIRDEHGHAIPAPDFEHDLLATTERLPRDVEFRRRYLNHTDQWRVLLIRGCDIFEQAAETDVLAAAQAFEQLLIADRAEVTP